MIGLCNSFPSACQRVDVRQLECFSKLTRDAFTAHSWPDKPDSTRMFCAGSSGSFAFISEGKFEYRHASPSVAYYDRDGMFWCIVVFPHLSVVSVHWSSTMYSRICWRRILRAEESTDADIATVLAQQRILYGSARIQRIWIFLTFRVLSGHVLFWFKAWLEPRALRNCGSLNGYRW